MVRRILAEAQDTPVSVKRMEEIALSHGFQETALAILPKLTSGAWPLLEEAGEKEYRSRLSQAPRTPLSSLQKSWLKALLRDRRIRLFLTDEDIARLTRELSQVQPLYNDGDFHYYERYTDGDPVESEVYRAQDVYKRQTRDSSKRRTGSLCVLEHLICFFSRNVFLWFAGDFLFIIPPICA